MSVLNSMDLLSNRLSGFTPEEEPMWWEIEDEDQLPMDREDEYTPLYDLPFDPPFVD